VDGGAAKEAAKLGREALGDAADVSSRLYPLKTNSHASFTRSAAVVRREPLSRREVLSILENMYDTVLKVEQMRRDQPPREDEEAVGAW
jgi:DNA topoisomerase 2-associated protein PAT1